LDWDSSGSVQNPQNYSVLFLRKALKGPAKLFEFGLNLHLQDRLTETCALRTVQAELNKRCGHGPKIYKDTKP
jgi:hypothetical protein